MYCIGVSVYLKRNVSLIEYVWVNGHSRSGKGSYWDLPSLSDQRFGLYHFVGFSLISLSRSTMYMLS